MSSSPERARVLLIGAGGVGAPAAWALARAGIGELRVLDDDVIEPSNLHRQILFDEGDVGTPKTLAMARALTALAPSCRVVAIEGRATPDTILGHLDGVDVVIDGTDRFAVRFLVADACHLAGKLVVHAAAVRWRGTVLSSAPTGRPCYRCLFEDLPEGAAPDCATAGVVGPVCGVVGGLAADVVLRALSGDASAVGTVSTIDGLSGRLRSTRIPPRRDCPLCGETPTIRSLDRARYVSAACEA